MAGTVTTDLVFFTGATGGSSAADALTDWTGTGLVVDTVAFVQGTGSIYTYSAASTTSRLADFACVATDIQNKVIYFWFALGKVGFLSTKAAGGLRLRVEDASANWGEWYVAGSDTLPHNGFICHAVHTSTAYNDNSATLPNKAAITKVCVRAYGSFPGKAYTWVDAVRIGTYLGIKAGTSADPAKLDDIITAEQTVANQWGILSKVEGAYFCQGKLLIGSTTAGEATYFKDESKTVVFKTALVPTDWFETKLQGNATAATQIFLGSKVGGRGISGCSFSAFGAPKYKITATDTNVGEFGFYGCSFLDADTIALPPYSTTKEVISCSFEKCAEVLSDTCKMQYCNFVSADGRGVRIASASHNITDCNFINCPKCVHCNFSAAVTFDNLKFSGSNGTDKWDIEHSVAGALTVNCTNGSNPQYVTETGGGSTSIINTVYLRVYVKDEANAVIQGASVAIYKSSDNTQLMNELSDVNGLAEETFNYPGSDVDIYARVRKSSTGTRYVPYNTTGTITSGGYTLTVVMIKDLVLV